MTHKSRLFIGALVGIIILSVRPAYGQSITTVQDLSFGAIVAGAGGTVTISPLGARTSGGDVTLMTVGQNSRGSAASFDLLGTSNAVYQITLPTDGSVILTGSRGGSMLLSAFTSAPSGSGRLNQFGTQTLQVGATLAVGNDQGPGSYSGNFTVTAVFQ